MSSSIGFSEDKELSLRAGRKLANPAEDERVVISGMAGMFPDSENVEDFAEKLFNKVDLISDDDRRWKLGHPEIPQRTGKLLEVNKFDAAFFGVHYKQAHTMDPMCRMILEKAYEAVVDAGINPKSLRGTKTGVFVGACFSESEKTWFYEKVQINGFGITGCSRAMLANRISYWLGINGPSYTVDSACSSSLYAFEHAYKAIRDGHCDAALVGGCNLCLHPYVSLQFTRLGVLSPDGRCKSFDEKANGYCRSEAISVVLLQKKKDAKRIYATVIHAKTNCDGYKEQGITFPSGDMQKNLLTEFYEECQINPNKLAWVEAHGTGTKVGDPEEVKALESVFCPERKEALMIGSIKSNIGHSEPASGLCSITKVLIAMQTGYIPPNINFNTPRADIEGLHNGKIKVITEKTPWNGGMVGINSFGFGGANCHVLLSSYEKEKVNHGQPDDDLPRIVPASGRTEIAVDTLLSKVESGPVDAEYIKLFHEVHKENINGHIYRGYSIVSKNNEKVIREIQFCSGEKRDVWFVFTGMGSQWVGMGTELMKFPIFANSIQTCHNILKPKGVDLLNIIQTNDSKIFDNILNSFVGIAAIQIALVDVLKAVGIEPDHIIGHSVGELGCAYADGCFTAEEMILSAYYRGLVSIETTFIKGMMAAIGVGYNDIVNRCPPDIQVACHNGPDSCTLSGPADDVKKFVNQLKSEGIFAKEVNVANIAYHSKHIAKAGPKLFSYLKKVIPNPKPRSSRWISTSVEQSEWNSPAAKYSSAEYHTNNLLNPVLFEEGSRFIPRNAITIEIAPHALLQAILRRSLHKDCVNVGLTQKGKSDTTQLFAALGKLFNNGLNLDFSKLYPEVPLPVSRGTPMLSHLIKWEHSEDWYVTSYRMQEKINSGERLISITLKDDEMEFLSGHVIDGRNLFPATGYLVLVWETLGLMKGKLHTEVSAVFKNVKFMRATNIPKEGEIEFVVMVQKGTGNFEVIESGAAIVSGNIYEPENVDKEKCGLPPIILREEDETSTKLGSKDIYKELRLRGYNYKGLFQSIMETDCTVSTGKIAWKNNWVAFMDNMLQTVILQQDTKSLFVPTSIRKLTIDVKKHLEELAALPEEKEVKFSVYKENYIVQAGGVEIRGLKASAISKRKPLGEPVVEKYQFVPYILKSQEYELSSIIRCCVQLALENAPSVKVKTFEIVDEAYNPDAVVLSETISKLLGDLPLIQADCQVLKKNDAVKFEEVPATVYTEAKQLSNDQTAVLVIGTNLLNPTRSEVLKNSFATVRDGGFILSREKINEEIQVPNDLVVSIDMLFESERFVLIKKKSIIKSEPVVIKITEENYSWIQELKEALKNENAPSDQKIIIFAEKEPFNGILGLNNCLRRETNGDKLRVFIIMDNNAKTFSPADPFYKEQLEKDLAVNVLKNGHWGSYRHLQLTDSDTSKNTPSHSFINELVRGDLSSLTWVEGPINPKTAIKKDQTLIYTNYASLNFRDVMIATGKIPPEVVAAGRINQNCVLGLEYSGTDIKGKRYMGFKNSMCLATEIISDNHLMWEIPDNWSLEDAATVPCVYGTAVYALQLSGRMKKGDSVLIHAGSGGVGQAAINLALHAGCEIFTTVGTSEKRNFIRKTFPQIKESHIGNSRDLSFEQMVMRETNGRGVDMVLNSLAEEKLLASVRCLAKGGRFLEIGKFDLVNNNPLGLETFLNETSFHGVILDSLFFAAAEVKIKFQKLFYEVLKSGAVKPLIRTIFNHNEVEQAFRYMGAGKHIGKVLIKIRDDAETKVAIPKPIYLDSKPLFYANDDEVYIIAGGLGGFGLELSDWLVLRGARKVVLNSRRGVKTGYQAMRIKIWETYGCKVVVSTDDITTEGGVRKLLQDSSKLGQITGIFNLAVNLKDAIFENQTEETFIESLAPKATATKHFDKLSRALCPEIKYFVVFSSVSCGRGNLGQANYGMANSIMERICEIRRKDNLPGLAIEWGAVGDVGLVADMQEMNQELVIGGTLPQRITSCLELMDTFIKGNNPIVASMVVAEKRSGGEAAGNIVDTVVNILGLRNLKTVSLHSTLAELGMDSMMAVEIKQTLEREFEVFLTPQDIRGMTFAKLQDIAKANESEENKKAAPTADIVNQELPEQGVVHLMRVIGDEEKASLPVVRLPSLANNGSTVEDIFPEATIFMIPGVEGASSIMEPLSKNIHFQVLCLQYDFESNHQTINEIASSLLQHVKSRSKNKTFNIVGYSFGAIVGLEMTYLLEQEGYTGKLILIDGSPDSIKELTIGNLQNDTSDDNIYMTIILRFIAIVNPQDTTKFEALLKELPDWPTRINYLVENSPESFKYSKKYKKLILNASINRIKAILNYEGVPEKSVKTPTVLIKPSDVIVTNAEEDYGLSKFTANSVPVIHVDGNHFSVLENPKSAEIINKETGAEENILFTKEMNENSEGLPNLDVYKSEGHVRTH